jgi:phospholipid transport system substrate-binding protein
MKSFTATDPSRRAVLTGATALLATALLPRPGLALNTSEAAALVSGLAGEVTQVINSGKREEAMYAEFERIFVKYADVPTIARSVLGPPARGLGGAQLAAYTQAFQGYISRKYGKRFREFIGGEITVRDARPLKSFFEVKCVANLRNEAPFDFTFLVSDRSGEDKFFDMLVEGVSLLKTEKTEVGAMLDRRGGNIDALIADLRKAG